MPINLLSLISDIFEPFAKLVDDLHTSDEEKGKIKNELAQIQAAAQARLVDFQMQVLEYEKKLVDAQKAVIVAEATGQSWIQRNWRPILMLVIVAIVANNFILFPYLRLFADVPLLELPPELFTLMTVGVGGYIVGRTGEKVAQTLRRPVSEAPQPQAMADDSGGMGTFTTTGGTTTVRRARGPRRGAASNT